MAARWSAKNRRMGTQVTDDSSDSETETEPARVFHRRISTNKDIKSSACTKEGYLLKQRNFQRWKRKYFKLKGRRLYYAKNNKSMIYDQIELTDLSVAECSTKNINHSFQVITPFRSLVLCADSRKDMEEWISAIKTAASRDYYESNAVQREMMSGQHNWYACSHARPTYCNVCREALSGVTSHGLSCEVCKFKAHKRCAVRANNNCKWTTLASVGKDTIENEDGIFMPHQWLEGNLPVSAKCTVCDKTCGSVLRLQDWRCLWCKAVIHTACRDQYPKVCPLGQCRVSVLPPIAINSIDSDGYWEATRPPGTSPLLVFVNSKSGDNQGVKFLRRFKQLLNPAQVFDLMNGGPHPELRLFQKFDPFRILVCGGDGSIGWVLSEIDKLDLHRQCQIGVLPFGTGNDLARVLGWGGAFDDDTQLPAILEKMEHAQIKMLDRWSVMTFEGSIPAALQVAVDGEEFDQSVYEDSVANHLSKILHSDDHSIVISSARVLCETVKDFVAKVGQAHEKDDDSDDTEQSIARKCAILNEKLESLLTTLNEEAEAVSKPRTVVEESLDVPEIERDTLPGEMLGPRTRMKAHIFKPRDALMSRANSLKKAIRQIIEHTEKAVDEQNAQTEHQRQLDILMASREDGIDDAGNTQGSLQYSSSASRSAPSFEIFDTDGTPKAHEPEIYDGSRSPQGPTSRRISSMSMFNRSSSVGSNLEAHGTDKNLMVDRLPFPLLGLSMGPILPSISSNIAGKIAGGSFISKVLLANADALCAAASPLIQEEIPLEEFSERCVMNNYFGIGLDAKISLDFHLKREEHPEKCRSRTKNMMWYSVLGGKEILQRTFKNLDQRVQLVCDGQKIPLPSLQGIVVLNIPSYMGGANFWGGRNETDNFQAPSFDDKILEVVAVFGSVQMAVCRVIGIQYHRIAQCRTVKITIMGDEGVPVQVDGEAWLQPPGCIRIMHKNRAQMLTRDRLFENTLKSWSDKQKNERSVSPQLAVLTEDESVVLQNFVECAATLIRCIKVAAISHSSMEQELFPLATQASHYMDRLYPAGKLSEMDSGYTESYQPTLRTQIVDFVISIKHLHHETGIFLSEKSSSVRLRPDLEEKISSSLGQLELELRRVTEINGVPPFQSSLEELFHSSSHSETKRKPGKFKQVYSKLKGKGNKEKEKEKEWRGAIPLALHVQQWSTEEVGQWLDCLNLGEYKENFIRHEIRGSELLSLERRDLKDLGVTKVGHLKRIQHGIKELVHRMAAMEKAS